MKNIRSNIDKWLESLDKRWDELPIQKQQQYALYFFTAYVLLTVIVIYNVWQDTAKSTNHMIIEHIDNHVIKKKESPAISKDTVQLILKNKIYEKK